MTEQEFLERFDNNEEFSERELSIMPWEMNVVETINGENQRWSRPVQTIFQIQDRLFAIDWFQGLTESQEHEFFDQPYEVKKRTRTIVINEYVKKE